MVKRKHPEILTAITIVVANANLTNVTHETCVSVQSLTVCRTETCQNKIGVALIRYLSGFYFIYEFAATTHKLRPMHKPLAQYHGKKKSYQDTEGTNTRLTAAE